MKFDLLTFVARSISVCILYCLIGDGGRGGGGLPSITGLL